MFHSCIFPLPYIVISEISISIYITDLKQYIRRPEMICQLESVCGSFSKDTTFYNNNICAVVFHRSVVKKPKRGIPLKKFPN